MALPAWAPVAAELGGQLLGGLLGSKGTSRKRERDSARIASEEALRHARLAPSAAVEGFQAAGIHPLFGLTGTSGVTAMPSYSTPADGGKDFSTVGQNIGRAAAALTAPQERAIAAESAKLGLENQQLQNDYLRTQILHMNSPGTPPGYSGGTTMFPGQNDVLKIPKEVVANTGTTEKGTRAIAQRFEFAGSPIYGMSEDFANAGNDDGPLTWLNQLSQIVQMGGALLGGAYRKGSARIKKSLSNAKKERRY